MSHMLSEAQEAPRRVREFLNADKSLYAELGRRLRDLNPAVTATIARGSSDHAATYASSLFPLCTGRVVASIPPSVVTVLNAPMNLKNQFVLAISQSGGSPDILRALEAARGSGALTAALVNVAGSPVAKAAEFFLNQHAGVENGLAATKTVLCTKTAIARLAAEWAEDGKLRAGLESLPETLAAAVEKGLGFDDSVLTGVSNVFVLSRGLGFGAAHEISLKLKETCGLHAEAFSTAEVRHGPREIVDSKYAVIALALPGSGQDDVLKAADELKGQGARVITVAPKTANPTFALPEAGDDRLAAITALQLLYPWLARVSVALGRDPDKPKRLAGKVIQTV